ncbi:MAG: glycosyltransferase [Rhodanobacteraceae bacterium]
MASINLIVYDNGIGLSRDVRLLADALRQGAHTVSVSLLDSDRRGRRGGIRGLVERYAEALRRRSLPGPQHDINLMIERVRPLFARRARVNLLLANPDWFKPSDARYFALLDGILVKTRHAEPIFATLGKTVVQVGFTGDDRLLPAIARERAFFHLAGRSKAKGTARLLALWQRHPEWPRLTVLQHPHRRLAHVSAPNIDHRIGIVDDSDLKRLQNAHAFHLCPSETEGFGHYIVEAMSVGALTVTVDASPMNELVTPERGVLVACTACGTQSLATTWRFQEAAMEHAIESIRAMHDDEIVAIGTHARAWFEANDRAFRTRIMQCIANWT